MALYLSPLVDVNEIDLSTTIPAVATSIAVTVLRDTYKGSELKRQLITNVDELIETFGDPNSRSYKDILSAAGYLKFGNYLYCTRVMPSGATFAGLYTDMTSGSEATSYTSTNAYKMSDFSGDDPDEFPNEIDLSTAPESSSEMAMIAISRGEWGNNIKVALLGKDKYDEAKENAGDTTNTTGLATDLYNDLFDIDASIEDDTDFIVIVKVKDEDSSIYALKETHYCSTETKKTDDEGKNIFVENVINNDSKYIRIAMANSMQEVDVNTMSTLEYQSFAGGVNSADDYSSDTVSDSDIIEAFELYEDPEEIDVNIFIDSDKSDDVKLELIDICEARLDSIAILDPPKDAVVNQKGQETTNLRNYRLNINSGFQGRSLNVNTSYACIYGNWLNVYDKWNAQYRWIPTSGHIAGVFANTDDVTDPWFAPAGLNRGVLNNVRKLAWNPNKAQRDMLYKNGINPIVSFSGQGKVIYGQKNLLDKSSAFNRINVRRLFIVLEKSISTAAKYFLFEPNDSFTRLLLVDTIEPFLRDIKARRGIYEFLVVCDGRNNTPERIDRNELWVDIYIKPTRAAEFIVLNFIATKTGASFTELVAATAAV